MKNILIITGRYLPGYKDGGPVRTIKNLTDMYGDDYHFTVMCADRDHGDTKAYDGIKTGIDNINRVGKADVVYVADGKYSNSDITALAARNDLVYVCGPYNDYAIKSLILNKRGKIKCPFVLAPMGSFSKGALAIGSKKKKLFLAAMKSLGLFNKVYFSVTSEVEKKEMAEALGKEYRCFIAEDPQRLPEKKLSKSNNDVVDVSDKRDTMKMNIIAEEDDTRNNVDREDRCLSVVFLSRISEKKNLLGAAEILGYVKSKIRFDVYGTMEDSQYFEKCKTELDKLPENISWEYKGEAESERVPEVLSQYDVFLFPTHGENFGHVISEALSAGTIPVISDTTPWLDFEEKESGYVLPHGEYKKFAEVIDRLACMPEDELNKISENARSYYIDKYEKSKREGGYINIFSTLIK